MTAEERAPINALPFFVRDRDGKRYAAAANATDAITLAAALFVAGAVYSPTFDVVEEATEIVLATIGASESG
jgi:hypothetical protein